jgi:hypothetical protein
MQLPITTTTFLRICEIFAAGHASKSNVSFSGLGGRIVHVSVRGERSPGQADGGPLPRDSPPVLHQALLGCKYHS